MNLLKRSLVIAGLVLLPLILSLPGVAAVSLDIRIGPPPVYRFAAPPSVVVIPGTYVYMVPDIDVDIFFFSGYWYRPYEGRWFRARSYSGPWVFCPDPNVPRALITLPPDYHRVPPGYRRIPHGDLRRNWGRWERDRHWDNDRDWREGWRGGHEERRGHGEERGRDFDRGDRDRDFGRGEHGRDMDRGEHGHGGR